MRKNPIIFRAGLFAGLLSFAAAASGHAAFQPFQNFPAPAPNAFTVSVLGLPGGSLLVWNGDAIYIQDGAGRDRFTQRASGYPGDPGFADLAPDGSRVLLGAGFMGELYAFDWQAPEDFTPAALLATRPHFSGAFLSNSLVILDAGKPDFTGSELVIVDLDNAKAEPAAVVTKSEKYAWDVKQVVADKPPFSFSGAIAVDFAGGLVYAMDANTREVRAFSISALINAFNAQTTLDWETDGVLIGAPGQYFSGGVSAVLPGNELLIGGSEGFGLPGGIQLVDADTGAILEFLDPEGGEPFYSVFYNAFTGDIIARSESGIVYGPSESFVQLPALGPLGLFGLALALAAGIARRRRG